MGRARAVDGVILLDKPTGITSNAALQRVKRLLSASKAGHVGTLDPLASGLLPICLGEATKFSTTAFAADKRYEAQIKLGVTSTTGDLEGEITARCRPQVGADQLKAVLREFVGQLAQVPPMYSALKRQGKPLYAYARAGQTVERQPRSVSIYEIMLLDFDADEARISVHCSKGTYIRVLAEDIGAALGCGAALSGLRRTALGTMGVERAITLVELEHISEGGRGSHLLPVDSFVGMLSKTDLTPDAARSILMGQRVRLEGARVEGMVRMYHGAEFLGLGEIIGGGWLAPRRVVSSPPPPSSAHLSA